MANQYDYLDAGFRVFGLHGAVDSNGDELPQKEQFKKPLASNWQHTPDWSDEQLEVMEEMGQFDTGFGVLCNSYIIIDIDPRNGGTIEQVKQYYDDAAFVVATGGGGWHIYFKAPDGVPLVSHLDDYKGIDFKSTGFVVGAGSLHHSGSTYEVEKGNPSDITDAPESLIKLLRKPDKIRVSTSMGAVDVDDSEVRDILTYIDPDIDYDNWVTVGMAIHHSLGGHGFDIWDEWSAKGSKYNQNAMSKHWHSFGKADNPRTLATVISMAESNGYKQPVEFVSDIHFEHDDKTSAIVDLKRPPGFVGQVTQWINNQCRYPRENLAVAAALQAIGNIAGLRYIDEHDGMSANLISFCVAGSSTGKEAIQQAFLDCMRVADMPQAVHGNIKSEQEIIRNLVRHQAAFYSIDELGIVLKKITNAGKSGATYLEGVIGLIMSTFSKANAFLPVSGDLKDDLLKEFGREMGALENKQKDCTEEEFAFLDSRIKQLQHAIKNIDNGLEKPFLSMIGYTTPVTFNDLVTYEIATNGFISRSMIFDEPENNPPRKKAFKREPMSMNMQLQLKSIAQQDSWRIEHYGDKSPIKTTAQAVEQLDDVYQYFWDMAEDAKEQGLEAIPRRGYEIAAKVSFILAIGDGVRTGEHITWAFELAKRDIDRKMKLAYSNMEQTADGLAVKIQTILENQDEGVTLGVISNRCRPHTKEDVSKILEKLVTMELVIKEDFIARNNKPAVKYSIK